MGVFIVFVILDGQSKVKDLHLKILPLDGVNTLNASTKCVLRLMPTVASSFSL